MDALEGLAPRRASPVHVHKAVQRLTSDELLAVIADYEAGMPSTVLKIKFNLGKATVIKLLRDHGVQIRNQGFASEHLQEACQLYRSGASLQTLGERFNCDAETVRKGLKAVGVVMRRPWERG